MICDRVRNTASAYLDQELSSRRRRQIDTHLEGCRECDRWFDSLHRTLGALAALGEVPLAPATEQVLVTAFRRWSEALGDPSRDPEPTPDRDDLLTRVDRIQNLVFQSHEEADRVATRELEAARRGSDRDRLVVALACKGNTLRLRNRFDDAARLLAQAERESRAGAGCSPRASAIVAGLRGSLADALGQFERARVLYEKAVMDARAADDSRLIARSRVGLASALLDLGQEEEALRLLREAAPVLREVDDQRWEATALHNIVVCLQELERFPEAYEALGRLQGLCSGLGESLRFVKLAWLEASVLEADGRLDEAAERLAWVRRRSLEERNPYWAAFAALDLAGIRLQQGRTAEIRDLAHEMIAVFRSFGIQRETLAALLLLSRAAELEQVTAQLLAEVSERLQAEDRRHTRRLPEG